MSMRYLMICGHVLYIDYWFESRTKKCHRELVMWKQHHCVAGSCAQWFSLVIIWYQAATLLKSHVNRGEEEVSSLGESLSRILNDLQEAQATKEDKERWVMFSQPVSQTSGGDWTLKETIIGNG